MKKLLTILLILLLVSNFINVFPQQLSQKIRGVVIDKVSQSPIPGVNVILINSNPQIGAITDENGEFCLDKIPIGRQGIKLSCIGYEVVTIPNLDLRSAKEQVLTISMEEKVITTDEIVIKGNGRKDLPNNELAVISSRSFTIEQTERYAGSWGDPSRMASSFAGVMTSSDQVNDIIIRGNSPNGLLWRLEGINIPNPNHFGALGSTGGPISMLNNNVLTNSDFYSGAFPAGFGNALAGSFDLKMRSGNNEKREYLGQIGFNGFELGIEGPFSTRSKASYLANYRYSTLSVFDMLGIDMGIGAIPKYQDLSFKIDVPIKKAGRFSLFGVGGISKIGFDNNKGDSIKSKTDFTSDMGVIGLSHLYIFNPDKRMKTIFAISGTRTTTNDSYHKWDALKNAYGDNSSEVKYSVTSEYAEKLDTRNQIVTGFIYDYTTVSYLDSFYVRRLNKYFNTVNINDGMGLFQGYANWQHKFDDKFEIVAGLHLQYAPMNLDYAYEPRLGLKWEFRPNQSLTLGFGQHSQLQPKLLYFYKSVVDSAKNIYQYTNDHLKFSRSRHFVLGYHYLITSNLKFKAEAYYQYLYDIPVEKESSYVSVINYGATYSNDRYDKLVNEGTGKNFGLDLTLERFLNNNFYFLVTTSLFDSKYKGSDGIERNTAFNGNYVINTLGGYEFKTGKQNSLGIDIKAARAGGMRSIPIDLQRSIKEDKTVFDYDQAFKKRYDDYYRIDLRLTYKINKPKYNIEWAIDIQNITNHKNRFAEYYDNESKSIEKEGQMGLVPVMMWRVQF